MSRTTIRNFIIASIVLLVTGGVFGYLLYASNSQQMQLQAELETINKREAQEVAYLQARRTAQESVSDRALLDGMFIEEESESIEFLSAVETLATRSGVTLKTDSLEIAEDKKAKTKSLLAGFTFDGRREAVEEFIKSLEQLQYVAEIDRFSLSARSSTNWQAQVTMRVNIQKYAE